MLIIYPIQTENASIVCIIFLAQLLVGLSLVQNQLSIRTSTQDKTSFWTVLQLVYEISM